MELLKNIYDFIISIPLPAVLLATAAAGIAVIVFLAWQARAAGASGLKRHRSGAPGVADLLNWASVVDNGVILNKNGSLMAAWVYRGGDSASATNADRNAVSRSLNAALNQLGSGWMIHIDAIRRPCPSYSPRASSHFPDAVSEAMDEERRQFFSRIGALYEGCFVLTATYFPPLLAQAKFVEMMFDDPAGGNSGDLSARGTKILEEYKRKWKQKIRGFVDQVFRTDSGSIDHDAKDMFDDCEMALTEVNSGVVSMGLYTSVVVLMDEDPTVLRKSAEHIRKTLGALGFPSRIEDVNTMDAFFGSLPGHGVENVHRALMNTRHLADLMPTSSIWTGRDHAPCNLFPEQSPPLMHCVTTGSTPFRLNLHVGDLGHTLILGRTGGGKSVLLGILAAQFLRYLGSTVYVFDKGRSMHTLCRAVGGRHYNVAGQDGGKFAFCPLQWLQSKADLSWACFWIESLAALNGVNVTPAQRNEIARRMDVFHKSGERTLLSFVTGIMDAELAGALEMYTREGMFGHLLDADGDSLDLKEGGGLTVFEIEDLMAFGDPKIIVPVLLYLFRRIERSLRGQPAAIFLDEAWLMLGHPVFRDKLREWFKIMRKNNCSVIIATQSLSDVTNSGIVDVIKESTATKIYLPNPHARTEDATELYRRMGLNGRQIDIIANAVQKRQYYFTSEEGNRLFELALGPLQLALAAVSDKESLAGVAELERRHGNTWLAEWLALRGVDAAVIPDITKGTA